MPDRPHENARPQPKANRNIRPHRPMCTWTVAPYRTGISAPPTDRCRTARRGTSAWSGGGGSAASGPRAARRWGWGCRRRSGPPASAGRGCPRLRRRCRTSVLPGLDEVGLELVRGEHGEPAEHLDQPVPGPCLQFAPAVEGVDPADGEGGVEAGVAVEGHPPPLAGVGCEGDRRGAAPLEYLAHVPGQLPGLDGVRAGDVDGHYRATDPGLRWYSSAVTVMSPEG